MLKRIINAHRRHKILQAIDRRRALILSYNAKLNAFIVRDVHVQPVAVYQVYYWPADRRVVWDYLYSEREVRYV